MHACKFEIRQKEEMWSHLEKIYISQLCGVFPALCSTSLKNIWPFRCIEKLLSEFFCKICVGEIWWVVIFHEVHHGRGFHSLPIPPKPLRLHGGSREHTKCTNAWYQIGSGWVYRESQLGSYLTDPQQKALSTLKQTTPRIAPCLVYHATP